MTLLEFLTVPFLATILFFIHLADNGPAQVPARQNEKQDEERDAIISLVEDVHDLLDDTAATRNITASIAKLKAFRRRLTLAKRLINERMRERRLEYTRVRRMVGFKPVGGGTMGAFARALMTQDHHAQRVSLAEDLQPDEALRRRIEEAIARIDYELICSGDIN